MTDIVKRLRQPNASPMRIEAADEIERLRKELADLEAATTPWRELQDMKKRIDALEPIVEATFDRFGYLDGTYFRLSHGLPAGIYKLYDLRGIKE